MKKFVIGYINFFDNILKMEIVEEESEVKAIKKYLKGGIEDKDWVDSLPDSIEEIQEVMFNCDATISSIEI